MDLASLNMQMIGHSYEDDVVVRVTASTMWITTMI